MKRMVVIDEDSLDVIHDVMLDDKIVDFITHNIKEYSEDAPCSLCGTITELRPYGKDGNMICYECGMSNAEETRKQYNKLLNSTWR